MQDNDLNEALKLIEVLENMGKRGLPRALEISNDRKEDTIKLEEMGTYATRKAAYKIFKPLLEQGVNELRLELKRIASEALDKKAASLREELTPAVEVEEKVVRELDPSEHGLP
jgi:hypothetical protein